MKLRRCVFLLAALYGAQVAAGAEGARPVTAAEGPGETNLRIERIERDPAAPARPEAVTLLPPPVVPAPLERVPGDHVFRKAYEDVYRILSGENDCSRFYGGPARAALVFNKFAATLKSERLESARMGGTMSGGYYNVKHAPTGQTYRLFERAVINSDGPFYRRQISSGRPPMHGVGRFGPATREARALILLHELGHLMRGGDGKWLLPDDGNDGALSTRNTAAVEDKCGDEIRALAAKPAPRAADEAAARPAAEGELAPEKF